MPMHIKEAIHFIILKFFSGQAKVYCILTNVFVVVIVVGPIIYHVGVRVYAD